MSKPDDEITVIKMSGLNVEQKKDTIISAYTKPSDIPPPPLPPAGKCPHCIASF